MGFYCSFFVCYLLGLYWPKEHLKLPSSVISFSLEMRLLLFCAKGEYLCIKRFLPREDEKEFIVGIPISGDGSSLIILLSKVEGMLDLGFSSLIYSEPSYFLSKTGESSLRSAIFSLCFLALIYSLSELELIVSVTQTSLLSFFSVS